MSSENASSAAGAIVSAVKHMTKTQTQKVLLSLINESEADGDKQAEILQLLSLHIKSVIDEDQVPDSVMIQELDTVDGLLEIYAKSADKKLLSDVTVKIHDLFVILQSRNKDQKWQTEVQQRATKLQTLRGKNFPDPSIFNSGFQKRGWMDKRTRSIKGWKRHWFVLKGHYLTYFAKAEPSPLASSNEWGNIIKEGSLRKKKQGKGWKTRWVQIRPEGLLYFKTQKDKEPIGALPFAECVRVENHNEKSVELTYSGVKYYFMAEKEEEFSMWSSAFDGVCPETNPSSSSSSVSSSSVSSPSPLSSSSPSGSPSPSPSSSSNPVSPSRLSVDPNMSYFTIRRVIDLSSAILDDKATDKPHCFTVAMEGGRSFLFSVDSERQKQEWLHLLGSVVKVDNSSRKARSAAGGNGIMKQPSFESGRTTPTGSDSPAVVRYTFKDEAIGKSLAVRNEGDSFDAKFTKDAVSEDEEEEEKEEGEEAARERTNKVRRETIKLIRTFKLEVHLEDQKEIYTFQFDNSVLVDQVKSYIFKHIPALVGCNQSDYSLGVDADELLTVEFLRFVSSNTFIEVAVRTCGIARVGLYLRDNLRKINEERQNRRRPLKNTTELTLLADTQKAELEAKWQQEKDREKAEREKNQKTFASAATQTDEGAEIQAGETKETKEPKEIKETKETKETKEIKTTLSSAGSSDKISWRNQTSQILPSGSIIKKVAEASAKSPALSPSIDTKPKTMNMITKTTPRPGATVWQQVQPSLSATKRPMIIPCEGWAIEVPGEPLPAPTVKSWQFCIATDGSVSETPEPFFYRKYFITAKKLTNFLGSDPKYGSISFSMCTSADAYRGVLFTKLGTRQVSVLPSTLKAGATVMKSKKQQILHFLLSKLEPSISAKNLRPSVHPDMPKELLSLEERQVCSGFKFGVVYAKNGQTDENDLFNNESGSEEWNEFLELLGNRIQLKGWTQYNAGLDVKDNSTGTHSMFTTWKGNEIMFHVSTMLPYHAEDTQKLERKRHVGNDICVIIFQEGATPYLPTTITSHFNHIIAVVHYDKAVGGYRLGFAFKEGVPAFGPVFSNGIVKKEELKEMLLTKLINGETASLLAPVFAQKLVRTREALLNYYLQQFL